tara:strand:+ start:39 stop:1271 length:1233 start_codon:yes stop_codon:yes gene_type:complete
VIKRIYSKLTNILIIIKNFNKIILFFTTCSKKNNILCIENERIGHFPVNIFLSSKIYKNKNIFFFKKNFNIPNDYIIKKIKENYNVDQKYEQVFQIMKNLNELTSGYFKFNFLIEQMHMTEKHNFANCFDNNSKIFEFTEKENQIGADFLVKNNINQNKFVCIIYRTSEYYNKIGLNKVENLHAYRNTNPKTLLPSIEYLLGKGYSVIRLGKYINEPYPLIHKNFFDYAVSEQNSDFLDIWLSANCNFFINGGTGLGDIPTLFGVPRLSFSVFPMGAQQSWSPNTLLLPCNAKKNDKYLNLKEMIKYDLVRVINAEFYKKKGVEIVRNSSDEVLKAVQVLEENYKNPLELNSLTQTFWNNLRYEWNAELSKPDNQMHVKKNFDSFHKINGIKASIPDFFLNKYSNLYLDY